MTGDDRSEAESEVGNVLELMRTLISLQGSASVDYIAARIGRTPKETDALMTQCLKKYPEAVRRTDKSGSVFYLPNPNSPMGFYIGPNGEVYSNQGEYIRNKKTWLEDNKR